MPKEISSQDQLSPALHFLVACCQSELSEEDAAYILSYIQEGCDIDALINLSYQHGVLPLVHKSLKKLHPTHTLPSALCTAFKEHYMSIAQQNMRMTAELLRIMQLLKDHGIEALAFKGPTLAQLAYGDITLRQYVDLDILVREEEAYKAGTLLHKHGFSSPYPLSILQNKICMRVDSDFALMGQNLLIEMHWRLFRKNIGQHLTFDEFSKDSKTTTLHNNNIVTLSNELHLLYLSLHGSKHAWERIEWIADIDRFIRNATFHEERLKEVFIQFKADRAILTGFLLAHKLFKTPLQKWITEEIGQDKQFDIIYRETLRLLSADLPTFSEYTRSRHIYLYQQLFFKKRIENIKYFFESYFSISRNDCLNFPLPSCLRFLYIIIKPYRLVRKWLDIKK